MSDLSVQSLQAMDAKRRAELRRRAAARLGGAAAAQGGTGAAVDALTVLHTLASSPDTASDALKLLHELQVHQVELDLQAHELHESRAELESALRRQVELYDLQPAACFTLGARLAVQEVNQTGAAMLGLARDDAYGLPLDGFVCADSAGRLVAALARVDAGVSPAVCRLTLRPQGGPERRVLAAIARDAAAGRYLVSLMLEDEAPDPV